MDNLENPYNNPGSMFLDDSFDWSSMDFYLSDLITSGQQLNNDSSASSGASSEKAVQASPTPRSCRQGSTSRKNETDFSIRKRKENKIRIKKGAGHTWVMFRTKSKVEVMEDGYKWRKYGKKSVKGSPCMRNYYKCSNESCCVKKRIERDREDLDYVLTSYHGTHNHDSPSIIYYNSDGDCSPPLAQKGWTVIDFCPPDPLHEICPQAL